MIKYKFELFIEEVYINSYFDSLVKQGRCWKEYVKILSKRSETTYKFWLFSSSFMQN